MDNDSTAAASMSATNTMNDITNDMSKVVVSDNVICGTCTDTSSEQKKSISTRSDDASGAISIDTNENICGTNIEICANCGKEGANNTCNKCKSVKYCNATCKKKHKTKHKKACDRRVAELRDIELFKQPPLEEDCAICFLRLPTLGTGRRCKSCCGKVICSGCIYAQFIRDRKNAPICPFCRLMPRTGEEIMQNFMKLVEANDADALNNLGFYYSKGIYDLPQDDTKAFELWERAAELGHVEAHYNIGKSYYFGDGVERDKKKAEHYYEKGALGGHVQARHNLGIIENNEMNVERAIKHYMIAVEGGSNSSLKSIQDLYSDGHTTKDDYTKALRAYQKYLGEVKSPQRDEAAAFSEMYKYIE